jgi:hypothetical protein
MPSSTHEVRCDVPVPSTRSSELARIAAEGAGVDTSSVRFAVRHGPAGQHPDPIYRLTGPPPGTTPDSEYWPSDFSLFSAAGLSTCISTWPAATSAFSGPIQVGQPEATGRPDTFSYAGLTVPNPGFLNESTRRIDVLLTLGSTHWSPSYRDCLMYSLITERVSRLAMERAGGPVLDLLTPAAPFQDPHASERGDGSDERLRDAIGPCLRISVGVEPNMSAARLDFETGLADLAEEYGLGLRLDDRRFNRVRGEWFTIRGFDRERYRRERNRLFPDVPVQLPKQALIATVMAPARVGMATQVTGALRARGIGVMAASIFNMRKIGFINLVLPAADDTGPPPAAWSGDWDHAMKMLADRCATDRSPTADDTDAEEAILDCKFAVSTAMRCTYPPSSRRTGASVTGRVPYPVWLRWDVPHGVVDTPRLLARVQANLEPYAEQFEVAYAQSRLVHGDMIRGRAKLIVVLAHGHRDNVQAQRLLTDVAERAQERTLKQLMSVQDVEPGRARLYMSPRERWLAYARVSS